MIGINYKSNTPIYEQIIEGFKELVLMGHLKPGDVIPSVRRLAVDIGINPNTVGKAYQEMERLGIIETQRGKSAYISGNAAWRHNEMLFLETEFKSLVNKMLRSGFKNADISSVLESILEDNGQKGRTEGGN